MNIINISMFVVLPLGLIITYYEVKRIIIAIIHR